MDKPSIEELPGSVPPLAAPEVQDHADSLETKSDDELPQQQLARPPTELAATYVQTVHRVVIKVNDSLDTVQTGRPGHAVLVWHKHSSMGRLLESPHWNTSVKAIMAVGVLAMLTHSVVVITNGTVALAASLIETLAAVMLYVMMLSFMDRTLVCLAITGFDFVIVAVSQLLVNVSSSILLIRDDEISALGQASTVLAALVAAFVVPLLLLLADTAPTITTHTREYLVRFLLIAYLLYLPYTALLDAVYHENDLEICVRINGSNRCQSLHNTMRTAQTQVVIFCSKFLWRAHRNPGCGVMLRASVHISAAER